MLTTFFTKMLIMKKYNIFVKYCHLEIRFGLVWFGLVWFGLVWFGLVWLNIIQHIPLFCISLDIVKNAVNDLKNYFLKLLSGL